MILWGRFSVFPWFATREWEFYCTAKYIWLLATKIKMNNLRFDTRFIVVFYSFPIYHLMLSISQYYYYYYCFLQNTGIMEMRAAMQEKVLFWCRSPFRTTNYVISHSLYLSLSLASLIWYSSLEFLFEKICE